MFSLSAAENATADWGAWPGAFLLSLSLHALALALLYSVEALVPQMASPPIVPVTIREPAAPPRAAAVPQIAKPPAPAALPEPEPPPPPAEPERKLPLPEQQVVSPPEGGVDREPEKTRFLSDADVTVEQEQVRRGVPAPGPEARRASSAKAREADAGSERQLAGEARSRPRPLPDLKRLLPDAVQLAREGYGQAAESAAGEEAEEDRRDRVRPGAGWATATDTVGTLDFLPDVREGDITLLNTKADLFAPFVRRVAVRVFQNLLISLRRDLSQTGPSTREEVGAEAVMDGRGNMLAVTITERSPGVSLGIDRKLRQACADGFFDRNPPRGAEAADGNIHFVLRTQVASISDQRGYRVGYRVLFQAGLL